MLTDANDAWNSGIQNGISLLGARNNDLRRQQLQSELALRNLQQQQTAQHMALLLDAHNSQVDYEAAMAKAGGQIALATAPTISIPDPTSADAGGETGDTSNWIQAHNPNRMSHIDAATKFALPVIAQYDPKSYEQAATSLSRQALLEAQAKRQDRLDTENANFVPKSGTIPDPRGGDYPPIPYVQRSKGAVSFPGEAQVQNLTNPDTGQETQVISNGPFGTPKQITDAGARQQIGINAKNNFERMKFVEKNYPEGLSTDANGQTVILPGAFDKASQLAQNAPTQAVKTEIEKQTLAADKVAAAAADFSDTLIDANIGPSGALKSTAEKVKGMFGIPLGSDSATETRASAARLREELASLASATGLSAGTKQRIQLVLHDIPDAEKIFTGGPVIKQQLSEVLSTVANETETNYQRLGKPVPPQWMQPQQILDLFKAGKISKDQAVLFTGHNMRVLAKRLKDAAENGE